MRVVIRTRRTLPRIIPLMLGVVVAVAVVWFVLELFHMDQERKALQEKHDQEVTRLLELLSRAEEKRCP